MVRDPIFLLVLAGAIITATGLVLTAIGTYKLSTRQPPGIAEIKTFMSGLSGDVRELASALRAAPLTPPGRTAATPPGPATGQGAGPATGGIGIAEGEPVTSSDISRRLDELLKRIPERLQDAELREKQVEVARATAQLKLVELSRYSRPLVQNVWNRVEALANLLDSKAVFPGPTKILPGKVPRDLMMGTKEYSSGQPVYNPHQDNLRMQFPSAGEWWLMLLFGWVAFPGAPNPGDAHPGTDYRLPFIQLSRFPRHQPIPSQTSIPR